MKFENYLFTDSQFEQAYARGEAHHSSSEQSADPLSYEALPNGASDEVEAYLVKSSEKTHDQIINSACLQSA